MSVTVPVGSSHAIVDDEDYQLVSQYTWSLVHAPNGMNYAYNGVLQIRMHQLIMGRKTGIVIDHWNGDGLDCRRVNLREVTQTYNLANARKRKGTTSVYKGVCFNSARQNWLAYINKDYSRINIGSFSTEIEAAKAYDQQARKLFGEFSRLNFPDVGEMKA